MAIKRDVVKPKFQVGDRVWVIEDSKAKEMFVTLTVHTVRGIEYKIDEEFFIDDYRFYTNYKEGKVFATKEELIASL